MLNERNTTSSRSLDYLQNRLANKTPYKIQVKALGQECACGCGEPVQQLSRGRGPAKKYASKECQLAASLVRQKMKKGRVNPPKECECGCGELVKRSRSNAKYATDKCRHKIDNKRASISGRAKTASRRIKKAEDEEARITIDISNLRASRKRQMKDSVDLILNNYLIDSVIDDLLRATSH